MVQTFPHVPRVFTPPSRAIAWQSDSLAQEHVEEIVCKNYVLGIHSGTFLDKIWTWEGAWGDPWDLPGAPLVQTTKIIQATTFLAPFWIPVDSQKRQKNT